MNFTENFSKDEDVCTYDVIKTESLVTACEESCNNKNGNNTLCALLIQTHELLTAKFGENGAGKPPVLQSPILLDAAKKVENASKMLEENPGLSEIALLQNRLCHKT